MLKKRFNLRILAAIVACLAVTAVFASCDKDGNDDDDGGGSGKIDKKLVGMWTYRYLGVGGTDTYTYNFKQDGNFQYFVNSNLIVGKYYTSDGKIYLSDLVHTYDNSSWGELKVVEYVISSDNNGTYLQATQINRNETNYELKSNSMKYYKEN